MKKTLDLPDSLAKEVENRAQRKGCDLNDALIELLRQGLAVTERPAPSHQRPVLGVHPQSGFPYIVCRADAPARSMISRDLLALEHETLDREDATRAWLPG